MIVALYRWLVFLLAGFYLVWMLLVAGDYSYVGGPFRFLTIWALILSFFAASRMMALVERRSENDWPALVAVTATFNFMVVFLYWRLYLADPDNVTGSAGPPDPWIQYYIHALGPALQWADMLFIHRNIRGLRHSVLLFAAIVATYILWVEAVVHPFNDRPVGDVTSGLPYPFLNDLDIAGRSAFYAQTVISGLLVLMIVLGLGRLLRRKM
ncbi:MAG: hypothetical protein AAF718_01740 [Pseudomonadota bacterium]